MAKSWPQFVDDAAAWLGFLPDFLLDPTVSARLLGTVVASPENSVGYSETLSKMIDRGFELADAERIISRLSLRIAAFDSEAPALAASSRRHTKQLLSFADRACLALGLKTGFPVLTADRRWAEVPGQVKVELIR